MLLSRGTLRILIKVGGGMQWGCVANAICVLILLDRVAFGCVRSNCTCSCWVVDDIRYLVEIMCSA